MNNVRLYGPNWSAYTRTARLALIEKGVDHALVEVDFSKGAMPPEQLARQPFGKVPALEHGDFIIYETSAICRYVDSAFQGPLLQPVEARELGRMAQIIGIIDAYLSVEIRMGIVNEGLIKPMMGTSGDQHRLDEAYTATLAGLDALSHCVGSGKFLVGDSITLADLHAAPLFDYLALTPRGNDAIDSQQKLRRWWDFIAKRASITDTQPDLAVFSPLAS